MRFLVIALGFMFLFVIPALASGSVWDTFFNSPTAETYFKCSGEISVSVKAAASGKQKAIDTPAYKAMDDTAIFDKFLDLIESGDSYAMHLGFELYPLLKDDASLGKWLGRSLGKSMKKDPKYFLVVLNVHEEKHGKYSYDSVVTDYRTPEMDNKTFKKEADARIDALKRVEDNKLAELRDRCIRRLEHKKKGKE